MSWNLKQATLAAVVGLASVVAGAPNAQAFGWGSSGGSSGYSWGSSGGSSGYGWGSSGGSSGYGWGSSGGSSGYRYGLLARWRDRRAWYHGSSGGSSGYSHGSSGGSSGYSHGSSGGSSGYSHGSSGGSSGVAYGVPAGTPVTVSETPADAAVLNVSVPADAKVFVNGYETTSTGNARRYVSNGLENGKSYTYELKAEVVRDGKPVIETQVVKLQAGQASEVKFSLDGSAPAAEQNVVVEPTKTKLTLKVPADAKVFIAGQETKASGEVREFATTKLAAGQNWDNYTVRVEVTRDGQVVSHEEKLTLIGGENRELNVSFDAPKLAAAQ